MGTRYTTVTVSGYNSSPPSDDGAATEANKVKWSTIKTKLPDPLKTALEAINSALVAFVDTGPTDKTADYTTIASDHMTAITASSGVRITLGDASSMGAGYMVTVKNRATSGTVTVAPVTTANGIDGTTYSGTDGLSLFAGQSDTFISTGSVYYRLVGGAASNYRPIPPGTIIDYAGSSVPTGWLLCNGAEVSRSTYVALYGAIGTTWGDGDGSTTFNLPNFLGRTAIGDGTGTVVEISTSSSGNGWVVASNNTTWVTGMPVVLSALSSFTTSASAGPTYYVYRASATNIRLATTLALAQNGTPDITVSGTGSVTITHTMTARTLGETGGEEGHAMSVTELLAHTHTGGTTSGTSLPTGGTVTVGPTGSTGGNAAMNIMQPFGVVKKIISY